MSMEQWLNNPPLPPYIQFETSTTCQAMCPMCPRTSLMKRRGTMPWHMINKIIREIASFAESVCPFLYGEPFLEPRLTAILANLKQHNPLIKTIIYSNMNMLQSQTINEILRNDLIDTLCISFYGPTRELYAKWQPPLDYDKTVENIKTLHDERTKMGKQKPEMRLHVLGVPDIMKAKDGYTEIMRYVDYAGFVSFDTHHGKIPDMTEGYRLAPPQPLVPCERLWKTLTIHYDGSVVPCCIDFDEEIVLGNVNTQTIKEIWNSEQFQALRKAHLEKRYNDISLCRECRVYEHDFSPEWTQFWTQQK